MLFAIYLDTYNRVKTQSGDIDFTITASGISEQFLSMMFRGRKQPSDFCCPKSFRYRSETFPELAYDLKKTFEVSPPSSFVPFLLALVVESKMHRAPTNEYPLYWKRLYSLIVYEDFVFEESTPGIVRRFWRRFFRDEDHIPTARFDASYDSLIQMAQKESGT